MKLELLKSQDFSTFISAINKETACSDANIRINEILTEVLNKKTLLSEGTYIEGYEAAIKDIIESLEAFKCE